MYGDALTTKERIKDRLQISATSFDDFIDNLILAVTARMETMCGRRFTMAEFTNELHDGSDLHGSLRTVLIVKNAPVHAIEAIEYKAGDNTTLDWTEFDTDDYDVDTMAGAVYFHRALPRGMRNIRITYTGGWSGHSIGISSFWHFNDVPTGTVNGVNLTFTLPENADQVIVYADGIRLLSSNVTFTAGTDEFTLASGQAPFSSIAVDYLASTGAEEGEVALPAELVEVCEEAVVRIFKRRDAEGRSTETFQESTVSWREDAFSKESLATIKNYRRGDSL